MATSFSRRPGYGTSFTLPLVGTMLRNLALPSWHVLEIEEQQDDGAWTVLRAYALPMDPEEHSTTLTPAVAVQRGYEATAQSCDGVRGGSVSLRGSMGLEPKLGFDAEGAAVYAEGQAHAKNLQDFLVGFLERARAARDGEPDVRLIYRNLDREEAWIVAPRGLTAGRSPMSPLAYEYSLNFEILGVRPAEPRPFWAELLSSWCYVQSAVLTAAGYAAAAAALANEAGAFAGDVVAVAWRDPLVLAGNALTDLGNGIASAWQTPVSVAADGYAAARGLGQAWRAAVATAAGQTPDNDRDPEDDPERTAWTIDAIETAITFADSADTLALAAGALAEARTPTVLRAVEVLRSDTEGRLAARAGLTAEQIAAIYGTAHEPLVDPTGMLPDALLPGALLPYGGGAADAAGAGNQAGTLASAMSPEQRYGVNLRLAADGDLVPESTTDEAQDLALVSGDENLLQGLDIILRTRRGANRTFPTVGIDAPVGEPNTDNARVPARVVEALLEDDRVRSVTIESAVVDGDRIAVSVHVAAWGADLHMEHRG